MSFTTYQTAALLQFILFDVSKEKEKLVKILWHKILGLVLRGCNRTLYPLV